LNKHPVRGAFFFVTLGFPIQCIAAAACSLSAPHPDMQPLSPQNNRQPIAVLSDDLASQIAAGEVVERPASVVKELLENALDAAATRVSVSIEAGGLGLIAVSDDGHGMHPEDALLSLSRHATSKLRAFSELDDLASYGFRGEALPSIASVSRLEIKTRHTAEQAGLLLVAEGTTSARTSPCGHPVGTSLVVRDLFFNVPARRKFLRSSNTEAGHVSEVVCDAALCRPDVSFTLERDGRVVRSFDRVGSRAERAAQVLDETDLRAIEGQRGPVNVEAFLAPAERSRRGAGGLKLLINGRPVRDRALSATVAHAFGPLLERGRYPRGVVYLDLPRRLVDINVHPQKAEVRFVDARAVCDAVYGVIARGLSGAQARANHARRGDPAESTADSAAAVGQRLSLPPAHRVSQAVPLQKEARPISGQRYEAPRATAQTPALPPSKRAPASSRERAEALAQASEQVTLAIRSVERGGRNLRLLGQADDDYLICADGDGILIFDQHAADEVSIFCRLEQAYQKGGLQTQALLFPTALSLNKREVELVERHGALLYRLGLDLRLRSEGMVSLHGVMGALRRASPEQLVRAFLDAALVTKDEATLVIRFFAAIACKEAVGRNLTLSGGDAQSIVKGLSGLNWAEGLAVCEHGRPLLSVTRYSELKRKSDK
jgi:DNA mismatch repair protein MutL